MDFGILTKSSANEKQKYIEKYKLSHGGWILV
jgi:hypothetical protein